MIALSQVSNVLGVNTPLRALCARSRELDIPVLVDAAQGVSHLAVDVTELGCEFLACSAHKMYGPAGIGLLYGRAARRAEMEPLLVGGGMVDEVGEGEAESSCRRVSRPARRICPLHCDLQRRPAISSALAWSGCMHMPHL